ncbi:hypothetical protein BY458DRAFT_507392 [Sporodiniella umbellata]|nr:hypothetical protein BY458DRAFT_507392 [Sporodiniella umbellata]
MKTCSCEDYKRNRIACKHMYLPHRLHTSIRLYRTPSCLTRPSVVQLRSQSIETYMSFFLERRPKFNNT